MDDLGPVNWCEPTIISRDFQVDRHFKGVHKAFGCYKIA